MSTDATSPEAGRRIGSHTSKTRAVIVDAAGQLMVDHGHASLTYRSVAAQAGVTAGLVQYYFPTLEDLFVAVLQDGTDRIVEEIGRVSRSDQPVRALWAYASNPTGAASFVEFMAAANHRKEIWDQIGVGGERVRGAWLEALSQRWSDYGIPESELTPTALVFLLTAIGRMARLEEAFGTHTGHAETIAIVDRFLDRVEPRRAAPKSGPKRRRKA